MEVERRVSGWITGLFAAVVLLGGCAGPRAATEDVRDREEALDEEVAVIIHAAYEDFDLSPYADTAPEQSSLVHDVPRQLMDGRTQASGARSLDGFRIQIYQTQDPVQADALMEEVSSWWESEKRAGAEGRLFSGASPPVYNIWRQPYYRIRIGDFSSRDAADAALQSLSSRFTGAFVVPDRVTVR